MDQILLPKNDPFSVFVFGSNLLGVHAGGAAKFAQENYGAVQGCYFGIAGRSFAIPTMDFQLNPLPMFMIKTFVRVFLDEARYRNRFTARTFYVTPIGCGIAGFSIDQIAPLFAAAPANVILPKEFIGYGKKEKS